MVVVIQHFRERPAVNHRLVTLETLALFSLERLNGNGAKLNSLDRAPGIDIALENANAVKTGILKCPNEFLFRERAGNAAAPALGIALRLFLHFFIAADVESIGACVVLQETL